MNGTKARPEQIVIKVVIIVITLAVIMVKMLSSIQKSTVIIRTIRFSNTTNNHNGSNKTLPAEGPTCSFDLHIFVRPF